ncbi:MAG TPA: nicotinamide-nucleotide amidohydrolase family protein, partial [Pyrinomonadaceae bacterium]|nr:nicotinamide-nucleotide amidohydrolase family protein [Pyrinomonadaceae bacterium]
ESAVDEAIAPIYTSYKNVQTSILFNKTEIEIHLAARADSETKAEKTLDELSEKIAEKMGTPLFARNGETMEEVVGALLKDRGETIAVAESCTGGLISMRLTETPGSSAYLMEGIVAYSNEAKMHTVNVPAEILEQFGAVSEQTAEAMAVGARERAGTTYAISVTGIAGPDGGTEEKPVGTVCIGFADSDGAKSLKLLFPGDRYLIRWRSSQAALDYLRRQIIKRSKPTVARK